MENHSDNLRNDHHSQCLREQIQVSGSAFNQLQDWSLCSASWQAVGEVVKVNSTSTKALEMH